MPIRAVFFDAGETLINEDRQWAMWADWLEVPRHTFFTALGAVIERGENHRKVFEYFAPDLDVERATQERKRAGRDYELAISDFYPDALDCLKTLRSMGLVVGIAGNQPRDFEQQLDRLDIKIDHVASSARWKVSKPSRLFFDKVAEAAGFPPSEIAYVGDRLDNDVLPAAAAGMAAVFLVRGPWAVIQGRRQTLPDGVIRIESLAALPDALTG